MKQDSLVEKYRPLKQIVPSSLCLTCDVCCRFPEETSFLAPFFTQDEIARLGPEQARFFYSPAAGSKIKLQHHGEGCICPYFDPQTQYCKIYGERPLDCRIYPFAILRDPEGGVVLGIDTKCPFIQMHAADPEMKVDAEEVAAFLESASILPILATHPALIGPYQDDVIIVRPLERITEAVGRDHSSIQP
ncbi:YkgJ family cysteine cluster protein [Candidatus Manganitrophus noduliformans]|uniref:YkgJ family cysteine cluster protein n=1 Tax=Candidatus Manganitrophus noduliformans TaxID=2606439 RepID=A0A7X6DM35_9BACT|nr:YkgJ family cysteine cluster protein [Candidatus Manganitrophus noduliformans]NKE69622.1 YkgJ family cysteine cluster protein [Candidatus Manganitrophus noduliformans]